MDFKLTKDQITELNQHLSDPKLDLPSFRREITVSGANYAWLKKNIQTRNKNLKPKIKELLQLN